MVEILLDDFLVLKDLFNCRNIPHTGFELPNVLWKEINTAQHLTLAAAIAQPPPRQFPAVPRQFPAVPRQSRHFLRARKQGLAKLQDVVASDGDEALVEKPEIKGLLKTRGL
jgi:hypothetical protein